ncbi:membrane protein [Kocuria dechangensis]|uniref:Membrane protein n=1 Tax=Kocuria dechangensis TaxID=1176249 RepID=A0A917GW22_9MICC|nr:DUF3054 domain-containing protein [Kocuria dechangensis]GGG58913.1 membrane protein [Kocuria dechangensis]
MHTPAPATTPPDARPGRSVSWPIALTVDVALILLFASLGRSAHALDPAGVLETAWPFLAGLLVGWTVWRVRRAPFSVWPGGVALWLTTVAAGMVLRVLVGEGTALSFVLVTLGVLAVFLLGPRVLVQLVRGLRSRRSG